MHEFLSRFDRIAHDPLSYMHPDRMKCPTPGLSVSARQRAIINDMVLHDLRLEPLDRAAHAMHPWVRHWYLLPRVALLVGTWILRPELAWRGQLLRLPQQVWKFVAGQPCHGLYANSLYRTRKHLTGDADAVARQVQSTGLRHLLDWQPHPPKPLQGRLRLMFPPESDNAFHQPRRPFGHPQKLLILQAIHHAQNHPDLS